MALESYGSALAINGLLPFESSFLLNSLGTSYILNSQGFSDPLTFCLFIHSVHLLYLETDVTFAKVWTGNHEHGICHVNIRDRGHKMPCD